MASYFRSLVMNQITSTRSNNLYRNCFINIDLTQQYLYEADPKKVNAVDAQGETPVMVARQVGDMESVRILHNMKADLNVCTQAGTAMHRAALSGQAEMIKVISTYFDA